MNPWRLADQNELPSVPLTDHQAVLGSKTIYCVRHAESEENVAIRNVQSGMSKLGRLRLPSSGEIGDLRELIKLQFKQQSINVSLAGRKQIQHLQGKMTEDNFLADSNGVELIVHSTMKRAKITCVGIFEEASERSSHSQGVVSDGGGGGDKWTWGEEKYPFQKSPLTPYCQGIACVEAEMLSEGSQLEQRSSGFAKRILSFTRWLQSREETTIVLVGHSQFFRCMLGHLGMRKLANCEVVKCALAGSPMTGLQFSDGQPDPNASSSAVPWSGSETTEPPSKAARSASDQTALALAAAWKSAELLYEAPDDETLRHLDGEIALPLLLQ